MSVYESPRLVSDSDVLDAVYDFVLACARPALDAETVIRGWENRSHLPAYVQDYAVITLITSVRIGTNVVQDRYGQDGYGEDEETISTLKRIDVQIDFCSSGIEAGQRASCVETIARSAAGVAFFKDYGLSCQYADDVRSVDFQDGTKQQVHRHTTTLHLSGWFEVAVSVPHATAASPRIENVDAHHRP